jgi:hypothetical protein
MSGGSSGADQVRRMIERLAPEPICDDCIADKLALADGRSVAQTSRELAGQDGFERARDRCTICGVRKRVTRKRPRGG